MSITRFNAPWIVAFQDGEHRLLRNGSVVVADDRIDYVGTSYFGSADETIVVNAVITPGLISTDSHLHESPLDKTLGEDAPRRQFWSTTLIDILPTKAAGMRELDQRACTRVGSFGLVPELRAA